jgi:hypothetical protein
MAGDSDGGVGVLRRLAGKGVAAALIALEHQVGVDVDQEPLRVRRRITEQ